jgi:mono/diheme cytochrome c family protein
MDLLTRLVSAKGGDRRGLGSRWFVRVANAGLVAAVVVAASCGGSSDGSDTALSPAGASGQDIAKSNGCTACHGSNGQGGVGPSWVGLYGSEVELEDGTTVTADDDYLTRAIADPGAEIVGGSTVVMPDNGLSDDEIADVVAYIRDLSTAAATTGP